MNVISLYAIRKSSYEYPLEHYSITLRVDRAIVTVVLRLHDVVDGGARLAIAIVAEVVQHETTAAAMLASLIADAYTGRVIGPCMLSLLNQFRNYAKRSDLPYCN